MNLTYILKRFSCIRYLYFHDKLNYLYFSKIAFKNHKISCFQLSLFFADSVPSRNAQNLVRYTVCSYMKHKQKFPFSTRAQLLVTVKSEAYIFQRPFLRGLYSEGRMYGGKVAFQNRLDQPVVRRKFTIFALFYFVFEGKFQVQVPRGLIFGGAI